MFHANLPHTVLSERLHNYLRRKELTHAEFAKLAGIGTSTVTRCLNNDYIPSTEVYRKIAAVMKVEPETLAKRDDKEERSRDWFKPQEWHEDDELLLVPPSNKPVKLEDCLIYSKRRERRERIKFGIISVCGFIAVSAWFAMLFVALQS